MSERTKCPIADSGWVVLPTLATYSRLFTISATSAAVPPAISASIFFRRLQISGQRRGNCSAVTSCHNISVTVFNRHLFAVISLFHLQFNSLATILFSWNLNIWMHIYLSLIQTLKFLTKLSKNTKAAFLGTQCSSLSYQHCCKVHQSANDKKMTRKGNFQYIKVIWQFTISDVYKRHCKTVCGTLCNTTI